MSEVPLSIRYRDQKVKAERAEIQNLKKEEGIVELTDKELEEKVRPIS